MRAPKHLYVLAAGCLIVVAYLFSVRGLLYALCVTVLMIVVAAYLFSLNYLMEYLRRFHTATWAHLGRPSFPTIDEHTTNPSRFVQSGLLMLRFIFSTKYKSLEDERLNRLIWLIRILLFCGVVGTIVLGILANEMIHLTGCVISIGAGSRRASTTAVGPKRRRSICG
jgi:hypothetical protein